MEKTIWTPRLYGRYDFSIHLDREFAKEMIQSIVPRERQARMNSLANEKLKKINVNWLNPYDFHESSCLVTQIYLGQNGVWLATNYQTIENILKGKDSPKPIEYSSHNVDTSSQVYALMMLFDNWIEHSSFLKSV